MDNSAPRDTLKPGFPAPRIRALKSTPARVTPPSADPSRPARSLHLNESPFPPSRAAVEAMQAAAAELNRYPDHDGLALTQALAARNGVSADRIVIGAGSNEILFASSETSLDPGDEVVMPEPGFPAYAKGASMADARIVGVPIRADGVLDIPAMLAAVTDRTRLVFVSSPHNPTGGLLAEADIRRLVADLPDHLLLHYDEAYYEFGRAAGGPDTLPILAERTGPWIATRSFSKAYGLAGARIGYGIASSAEVADAFRRIRINFSVGSIALAGALAALGDVDHLDKILNHTAAERDYLTGALRARGLQVLPSAANFVTVITPRPSGEVAARLAAGNIHVIALPWRDTPGALRITIGTRADSDATLDALAGALAP